MDYPAVTIVEIHHAGAWHRAGELRALGTNEAVFSYDEQYVFGDIALPVSLQLPVSLSATAMTEGPLGPQRDRRPPAFVYDLVPQGRGRKFLLDVLKLADADEMVMPLVMAGAFNPIGCIRLRSALDFYEAEAAKNPQAQGWCHALAIGATQRASCSPAGHASLMNLTFRRVSGSGSSRSSLNLVHR